MNVPVGGGVVSSANLLCGPGKRCNFCDAVPKRRYPTTNLSCVNIPETRRRQTRNFWWDNTFVQCKITWRPCKIFNLLFQWRETLQFVTWNLVSHKHTNTLRKKYCSMSTITKTTMWNSEVPFYKFSIQIMYTHRLLTWYVPYSNDVK
jgi:hypothetical protein